jgi:hypothetical protein
MVSSSGVEDLSIAHVLNPIFKCRKTVLGSADDRWKKRVEEQ